MLLSVKERLEFHVLIPEKGNFLTMQVAEDIRSKVIVRQEEASEIGLKVKPDGNITWDIGKAKEKDIEFTEAEKALVVQRLKELDAKGELNAVTFAFHKKFI